jgi:formylglycine-generating enzyme required for sulfatase activity
VKWFLAVLLLLGTGLWWSMDARRTYTAISEASGDIGGIWDCGALAHQEGRPSAVGYGCMVPLPSHRILQALTEDGWPEGGPDTHSFWMGAQSTDAHGPGYDAEASPDEAPVRRVTLDPFWITRYEITSEQFGWCVQFGTCTEDQVGQGGDFHFGREESYDHPINGVTWFGADTYCRWTGGRLPTEAEWEFAARGGGMQREYPWHGGGAVTCEHATHAGPPDMPCGVSSTSFSSNHPRLADVHEVLALNLAGNVWEWTADWYAPTYGAAGPVTNPTGPPSGPGRVQRGGGYTDEDPLVFRSAFRGQLAPDMKLPDVGFRCAAAQVRYSPTQAETSFLRTTAFEGWEIDGEAWTNVGGTATPSSSGGMLRWTGVEFGSGELLSHMWLGKGIAGLRYGLEEDSLAGFELRIDADERLISLIKHTRDGESTLETGLLAPPPRGSWHRLGVRVEEGIHRVLSRGAVVLVVYDSTWPGTGVAVFAEPGTDLHVSDVAITD